MATKYPIVLVHGIATKQLRILNAFGKIGNKLEEATVQTKIKTAENIFFIAHRQKSTSFDRSLSIFTACAPFDTPYPAR